MTKYKKIKNRQFYAIYLIKIVHKIITKTILINKDFLQSQFQTFSKLIVLKHS